MALRPLVSHGTATSGTCDMGMGLKPPIPARPAEVHNPQVPPESRAPIPGAPAHRPPLYPRLAPVPVGARARGGPGRVPFCVCDRATVCTLGHPARPEDMRMALISPDGASRPGHGPQRGPARAQANRPWRPRASRPPPGGTGCAGVRSGAMTGRKKARAGSPLHPRHPHARAWYVTGGT